MENSEQNHLTSTQKDLLKYHFQLDDELINDLEKTFSYSVLLGISFYFREKGSLSFIKLVQNDEQREKLKKFFDYLDKHGLLSIEYIPETVLFFEKYPLLVNDLLKQDTIDEKTIDSLLYLIQYVDSNDFNFTKVDEIRDSRKIRIKLNEDWLNRDIIYYVKIAIKRILFGYLPDKDVLKYNNIEIPIELQALYAIEKEIDAEEDIVKLRERFQDLLSISPIINYMELKKIVNNTKTDIWNHELSNLDMDKLSYINGTSFPGKKDKSGKDISSDNKIKVYTFDGQPFKFLAHVTKAEGGANYSNKRLDLVNNPELWDKEIGSTYISTSLISDTFMSILPGFNRVIYGFNNFQEGEILATHIRDAGTSHENGKKTSSEFDKTPNYILANSWYNYSEITLKRIVNNQRISPDFIICFDGEITEESKLAAQYFEVPIYMIYSDKYHNINKQKKEMYDSLTFAKFDESDIDYLLYSRCLYNHKQNARDEVQYCFRALNYSYETGIINDEQYLKYNQYIIDSLIKSNYEKAFINYVRQLVLINTNQMESFDAKKIESLYWSIIDIHSTSNCSRDSFEDIRMYCFMDVCIAAAKKNIADIDKIREIAMSYIKENSKRGYLKKAVKNMEIFLMEIEEITNGRSLK